MRTFILFLENDDDTDRDEEDAILDQPGVDENMDFENNDEPKLSPQQRKLSPQQLENLTLSPQQLEHLTF